MHSDKERSPADDVEFFQHEQDLKPFPFSAAGPPGHQSKNSFSYSFASSHHHIFQEEDDVSPSVLLSPFKLSTSDDETESAGSVSLRGAQFHKATFSTAVYGQKRVSKTRKLSIVALYKGAGVASPTITPGSSEAGDIDTGHNALDDSFHDHVSNEEMYDMQYGYDQLPISYQCFFSFCAYAWLNSFPYISRLPPMLSRYTGTMIAKVATVMSSILLGRMITRRHCKDTRQSQNDRRTSPLVLLCILYTMSYFLPIYFRALFFLLKSSWIGRVLAFLFLGVSFGLVAGVSIIFAMYISCGLTRTIHKSTTRILKGKQLPVGDRTFRYAVKGSEQPS